MSCSARFTGLGSTPFFFGSELKLQSCQVAEPQPIPIFSIVATYVHLDADFTVRAAARTYQIDFQTCIVPFFDS